VLLVPTGKLMVGGKMPILKVKNIIRGDCGKLMKFIERIEDGI
jgi:hypothetical protein